MKTTYIEVANVREVINYVEVNVPAPRVTINPDKPMHNNLLNFPCVFTSEAESICIPLGFIIKEEEENELLKKNGINVEFFLDDGAEVEQNVGVRVFGTKFITNVKLVASTVYDVYRNVENKEIFAVSKKNLESDSHRIVKLNSNSLYFVLYATSSFEPYTEKTKLKFGMFYKLV